MVDDSSDEAWLRAELDRLEALLGVEDNRLEALGRSMSKPKDKESTEGVIEMTTCFEDGHMAPQRLCSLCGAYYCDASDHQHTRMNCWRTLRERFEKLQHQYTETYLHLVEAESRLSKEELP